MIVVIKYDGQHFFYRHCPSWKHSTLKKNIFKKVLFLQYPVVSIDDWIPVHDVITFKSRGHLKITHAMGTNDQVKGY